MAPKVLVVGLDGMSFTLLLKWTREGKLPSFRKIMEEGSYGPLESTVPPITIPAWLSMFTGLNPGKIGGYGFQMLNMENYNTYIVNSNLLRGKRVWEYLGERGGRVGLINVPGTYPPKPVNGYMISGMLTPSIENEFTYPSDLKNELQEKFLDKDYFGVGDSISVYNKFETRFRILKWFLEKDLDLIIIVFMMPDHIGHEPRTDEGKMLDCYKFLDKKIGLLSDMLRENYDIFIVSDHGLELLYGKSFFINSWLNKNGYLHFKKEVMVQEEKKTKLMLSLKEFFLKHKSLGHIITRIKREKIPRVTQAFNLNKIDIRKTKAFSFHPEGTQYCGIWINRRDFNKNIVSNEIIEDLKKLEFIETIFKKEYLYKGEFVRDFPDIIVKGKGIISNDFSPKIFSRKRACHTMDGVFLAYGPSIKRNIKINNSRIIDIAPTLLSIYNLPIPKDLDGSPLKEIIT